MIEKSRDRNLRSGIGAEGSPEMGTAGTRPPLTDRANQAEPDDPEPHPARTPGEDDLGLALSGGGVRATLFSLGVIIGLIETNCHRRVRCVASVSGGSILNAALAHARPLVDFPDIEAFEFFASALSGRIAKRGVFALSIRSLMSKAWYLARYSGQTLISLAPILLIGSSMVIDALNDDLKLVLKISLIEPVSNYVSDHPWQIVFLTLLWLTTAFLLSRGLLQEAEYQAVVSAVASTKPGRYIKEWGVRPEKHESRVMHVLVATDLLSGQPFYFSDQFVHCRPYGWSHPENVGTAEALYSSAAFPAVFPPKKLRVKRLNFQNGEMAGELPRMLRLVDGGVYNNLGTDWFEVLERHGGSPPPLWSFGELEVDAPKILQKNVIVVNASAPSRSVQSLGPFTLARIMSVLYDNTVRPRVKSLNTRRQPLIDIKESPIELAARLRSEGAVAARAEAAIDKLSTRTDEFWEEFRRDTAGTETKLSSAGPRTAARLMLHGYLSSLVLLHVTFGANLPNVIRGEEYFLALVDRSGKAETTEVAHD